MTLKVIDVLTVLGHRCLESYHLSFKNSGYRLKTIRLLGAYSLQSEFLKLDLINRYIIESRRFPKKFKFKACSFCNHEAYLKYVECLQNEAQRRSWALYGTVKLDRLVKSPIIGTIQI